MRVVRRPFAARRLKISSILSAAASVAALVVWGVMDSVNQFNLVKSVRIPAFAARFCAYPEQKIIVCVQLWVRLDLPASPSRLLKSCESSPAQLQ